jgi:hypothetical protein
MSSSPISFDSRKNPFFGVDAFATKSPFESEPSDADVVSATAPEGSYTYAIVPSAPAVDAAEVESASSAVEVHIRWADATLHIAHLEAGRSFSIGEGGADYEMPADKIGASRLALVGADGRVLVPAGATARVQRSGDKALSLADAVDAGLATASSSTPGAHEIALSQGSRVTFELGGFSFTIASVAAGRKVAGHAGPNRRALGFAALSGVLHAAVFASMFAFMPALDSSEDGQITDDQRAMLAQTMKALAEREDEAAKETAKDAGQESAGQSGKRAVGEEGKMGSEQSQAKNHAFAIKGDSAEKSLSKAAAIKEAGDFGMVGLLNTMNGDTKAPHADWGDVAMGSDPFSANGNMWGPDLGEANGNGGLGLSGVGDGGGGHGFGVGLTDIGTVGRGMGTCDGGPCTGFGRNGGVLGGSHHAKAATMRPDGETKVGGRLPPEVIQRVIRQNFGRFRMCYQNGLQSNPNLQGRVAVRFVIGRDGSVGSATNGGSDLPDSSVVSCVVRSFGGLSFPQPEDGIVTVTYPIMFTPGS